MSHYYLCWWKEYPDEGSIICRAANAREAVRKQVRNGWWGDDVKLSDVGVRRATRAEILAIARSDR